MSLLGSQPTFVGTSFLLCPFYRSPSFFSLFYSGLPPLSDFRQPIYILLPGFLTSSSLGKVRFIVLPCECNAACCIVRLGGSGLRGTTLASECARLSCMYDPPPPRAFWDARERRPTPGNGNQSKYQPCGPKAQSRRKSPGSWGGFSWLQSLCWGPERLHACSSSGHVKRALPKCSVQP